MAVTLRKSSRLAGNGNGPTSTSTIGVEIPQRLERTVELNIESISPLISHAWSAKAMRQMLDAQMGVASPGREPKDPLRDFKDSLYNVEGGGWGMPAPSFKAAAVTAANDVKLKMTEMRRAFHVETYTIRVTGPAITKPLTEWDEKYASELAPYHKDGVSMRMDMVRNDNGGADIRFRGWWPVWKCTLHVSYNASVISLQQVVNLFTHAGWACGIGEWRPTSPIVKSGEFGRFKVV